MSRSRYVTYSLKDRIPGPATAKIIGGCLHYNMETIAQFSRIVLTMGDEFENYRFFVALDEAQGYLALMVDKPNLIEGRFTQLTDAEYDMCKAVLSRVMSEQLKVSEKELEDTAEKIRTVVKGRN